ncbi:MAG: metallophosphoesterase, partial [Limisphaerales bacterium]
MTELIQFAGLSFVLALDIVWWIVAMRLAKRRFYRLIVSLFMTIQLCCGILMAARVDLSLYLPTAMLAAIIIWHFFCIPALTGVGILSLVLRAIRRWRQQAQTLQKVPVAAPGPAGENSISRRYFIGACAALVPPLATFSITGIAMAQINKFRVRRFVLSLPSLPKALDGVTIAHVSDVHVGQWTHGPVLKKIVKSTNALRADLVVVTGDLINYELSDLSESIGLLKEMHGRYGLYMV